MKKNKIVDPDVSKEMESPKEECLSVVDNNDWDSLQAKYELFNQKSKVWLRIGSFVVISGVLIVLLCFLGGRLDCFEKVVEAYEETANSDILWFYGISLFSFMVAFLTIALALIKVFVFKDSNDQKTEVNNPISDMVSKLTEVISKLTDKIDVFKNDK